MKMNPVYKREMMVSSRSMRIPLTITVFNSILAVVALLNMYSNVVQVQLTADVQYGSFLDLYKFVATIEFVILMFIMPAITSGTISGERERQNHREGRGSHVCLLCGVCFFCREPGYLLLIPV